ncbi:MAG TPA: cell wall-binding repeat-containing protein [Acidimicrobiales bacterium]|nr:cell wall-binding repeat-containing protein [Acidimicrobiales bacterium]
MRSLTGRLALVAALVGCLAGALVARPLSADVVASTVSTSVIAGADRYDTARLAALSAFPNGAATAVIASGQNFPDGLAAAALAGALNAPLLLTPTAALSPDTTLALTTLKTRTVYIVGGASAVSASVATQLANAGYTVPTPIAGADRYATAAAVASAAAGVAAVGTVGGKKTAILVTGRNFPDALAAGAASYAGHLPILLTDSSTLTAAASSAITSLGIANVIIVGGTSAVSSAVESAVQALTVNGANVTTTRVQGATRFATAAAMASLEITPAASGGLGMKPTTVVLASGLTFPDALVASELGSPVLLDDPLPAETAGFLSTNGASISTVEALGGPLAVPPADLAAAQAAASAAPRSVVLGAVAEGVSFTATFSQPVATPTPANFTVNGAAGGTGITAVRPGPTATTYVVQTANVLNPGDVVAVNSAAPPVTLTGTPVPATSAVVPVSVAPSLVGSTFAVGGKAVELRFSKPVSVATLTSGLTLTSSGGATIDTTTSHWALSADSTRVTVPLSAAIGSADKLAIAATVTDLTPGTALALSNPQTLTATAAPTAVSVQGVHVASVMASGGVWQFTSTSDGSGPLPSGDTLFVLARQGSPADGVNGQSYKIMFAAAAGSSLQVASAVSSGVTTVTITVPSTAGVYVGGGALAAALNANSTFNALFVASGSGSADLKDTKADSAAQAVSGGAATSTVLVQFAAQVVPPAGAYGTVAPTGTVEDVAKYAVSSGAIVTAAYPLDDWAAPSVIVLTVLATSPAQALVTGTTTVTFSGSATGFGGAALTTPATATLS